MSSLKRILIAILHSLNICVFLLVGFLAYGYLSGDLKVTKEEKIMTLPLSWSDIPIQNYILNPFTIIVFTLFGIIFGSFYFLIKSFRERKFKNHSK